MKLFREFLPLLILLPAAYLGGLFFGKNPELYYYLNSRPAIRIGVVGEIPVAAFHELRSVAKVQLQSLTLPIDPKLLDMDLIWLTNQELKKSELDLIPPAQIFKESIFPHLTSSRELALPVLWNIHEGQLLKWMLAQKSNHPDAVQVIRFFMTSEFQEKLATQYSGFKPSLKSLVTETQKEQILSLAIPQMSP